MTSAWTFVLKVNVYSVPDILQQVLGLGGEKNKSKHYGPLIPLSLFLLYTCHLNKYKYLKYCHIARFSLVFSFFKIITIFTFTIFTIKQIIIN